MQWQEVIKELRETLTLQEIASHLNLTPQAISQLESGKNAPRMSTLGALMRLRERERAIQKAKKKAADKFDEKNPGATV